MVTLLGPHLEHSRSCPMRRLRWSLPGRATRVASIGTLGDRVDSQPRSGSRRSLPPRPAPGDSASWRSVTARPEDQMHSRECSQTSVVHHSHATRELADGVGRSDEAPGAPVYGAGRVDRESVSPFEGTGQCGKAPVALLDRAGGARTSAAPDGRYARPCGPDHGGPFVAYVCVYVYMYLQHLTAAGLWGLCRELHSKERFW